MYDLDNLYSMDIVPGNIYDLDNVPDNLYTMDIVPGYIYDLDNVPDNLYRILTITQNKIR